MASPNENMGSIDDSHVDAEEASLSDKNESVASYVTENRASDTAIIFLDSFDFKTWSNMPHESETHLPHFTNMIFYEEIRKQFALLYHYNSCESKPYFLKTWKTYRSHVKVCKVPSFTKCGK